MAYTSRYIGSRAYVKWKLNLEIVFASDYKGEAGVTANRCLMSVSVMALARNSCARCFYLKHFVDATFFDLFSFSLSSLPFILDLLLLRPSLFFSFLPFFFPFYVFILRLNSIHRRVKCLHPSLFISSFFWSIQLSGSSGPLRIVHTRLTLQWRAVYENKRRETTPKEEAV